LALEIEVAVRESVAVGQRQAADGLQRAGRGGKQGAAKIGGYGVLLPLCRDLPRRPAAGEVDIDIDLAFL